MDFCNYFLQPPYFIATPQSPFSIQFDLEINPFIDPNPSSPSFPCCRSFLICRQIGFFDFARHRFRRSGGGKRLTEEKITRKSFESENPSKELRSESMVGIDINTDYKSSMVAAKDMPSAPPLSGPATQYRKLNFSPQRRDIPISTATRDLYERLFDEGYRADIAICTENGSEVYAHASIIGMASPVIKGMLKKTKRQGRFRHISIHGVPHNAVRVFIRFLYSSCYEERDMEEHVLHLFVLSHVFVVPQLKRLCEVKLEHGLLNVENVVDIFQLALLCDSPRISLICHRKVLNNFKEVSLTEGWKAMKGSHPLLEKELLKSFVEEDNREKERIRKRKERKIYLQLYEAMEALVHICRDGCRTIGPHDKVFREDEPPCRFEACKGLESLVRHFAQCKLRIPGGCVHCKRMWQLLELHTRLCADPNACRVPLCRNFKDRIKNQNKKYDLKWRILVRKTLRSKSIDGAPYFSLAARSSK